MLNSNSVSKGKYDPTGPIWAIVSKSVANFRSIIIKEKLNVACGQDRIWQIVVATFLTVQRGSEDCHERQYRH